MGGRPWFIDELASAGRENRESEHAARYDAKMDADAALEVAMLSEFGLDGDATVVDFGAGTGQFVLAAAPLAKRVVAVDPSPVMLGRLREKLADSGTGNVEIVEAGFLSYEHTGEPADLVYSRLALHHLPDLWKALALRRVAAILRPGGVLRLADVVWNFGPEEVEERIEAWFASDAGADTETEWLREELEEHVRDEHSTFAWLLEPMIERAGLRIERAEPDADGIFARYLCAKPE